MELQPHADYNKGNHHLLTIETYEEFTEMSFSEPPLFQGAIKNTLYWLGLQTMDDPTEYPLSYVLPTEMLEKGAVQLFRDSLKYPESALRSDMREQLTEYLREFFASLVVAAELPS